MAGRFPGTPARFTGRAWGPQLGRALDEMFRRIKDLAAVLAGPPDVATNVGSAVASAGTSQTPSPDDHVHGLSILTTKGDLMTFGTAHQRLAVGANGRVLTADSTATAGVAWAEPRGGTLLAYCGLVMGD